MLDVERIIQESPDRADVGRPSLFLTDVTRGRILRRAGSSFCEGWGDLANSAAWWGKVLDLLW